MSMLCLIIKLCGFEKTAKVLSEVSGQLRVAAGGCMFSQPQLYNQLQFYLRLKFQ